MHQAHYRQQLQRHVEVLCHDMAHWIRQSDTVESLTEDVIGSDNRLYLHYPHEQTVVLQFSPLGDKHAKKIHRYPHDI
ncbi:hypothetical protein RZ760_015045 [Providencia rettgeri]|uniref:Uncharacterized protein n=1 Tax=Providencia stuartii TaxID=588 RepID=A0AAI9GIH9_PROST|nr:hypothetical protein [Providencia stuartii]MDV5227244.1 hypothetical protein [Providencia rettgeri]